MTYEVMDIVGTLAKGMRNVNIFLQLYAFMSLLTITVRNLFENNQGSKHNCS